MNPGSGSFLNFIQDKSDNCLFTFIPVASNPGFGLIMHRDSGFFMGPQQGSPSAMTLLVLKSDYDSDSLLTIMEVTQAIMSNNGLYLCPAPLNGGGYGLVYVPAL